MALVVVGYPKVSVRDDEWLASLRLRYPGLTPGPVGPHFTLVFPLRKLDDEQVAPQVAAHVREQLDGQRAIHFTIRCAMPVKDDSSEDYYIVLVPDEGFSGIVKLHDRLYTGLLAPYLRHDLPYIPHITVGRSPDAHLCRQIADELNGEDFAIPGIISSVDIISKQGDMIRTVESFVLG